MAFSRVKMAILILTASFITNNFEPITLADISSAQERGRSIQDILKWLRIGEPSIFYSPSNLQEKQGSRSGPSNFFSAFGNGPFSKFDLQFTFIKSVEQYSKAGFYELRNNSSFVKKYLIDMNMNIHGGNVLPSKSSLGEEWNEFYEWLSIISTGENQLILVDADSSLLLKDIDTTEKNSSFYTTQHEHSYTLIQFKFNGTGVIAEAMMSKGKLVVQMDKNGGLVQVRKPSSLSSNLWTQIAMFTKDELMRIAEITQEIWVSLPGRPRKDTIVALNTQHPDYISARSYFDAELNKICNGSWTSEHETRSKSFDSRVGVCNSTGIFTRQGCAIFLNEVEGIAEKIDSDVFLKLYENATEYERKQMLDMVTDIKSHQIIHPDEESKTLLQKIVEHDKMKKQVRQMQSINEVIQYSSSAISSEAIEIFSKLQNDLNGSTIHISPSKLASCLAHSKSRAPANTSTGFLFLTQNLMVGIDFQDVASVTDVGRSLGLEVGVEMTKKFNTVAKVGKAVSLVGNSLRPVDSITDIALSVKCLADSVKRLSSSTNVHGNNYAVLDVVNGTTELSFWLREAAMAPTFPVPSLITLTTPKLKSQVFPLPLVAAGHVNIINSDISLSVSEKEHAWQRRSLETLGSKYREYYNSDLVDVVTKKGLPANKSKEYAEYLKNNANVRGIVLPSRTLSRIGSCRLLRHHCELNLNSLGCLRWRRQTEIGRGCEIKKPCPDTPCRGYIDRNVWDECECRGAAVPIFGYPKSDQLVDLREKRAIHHYRAMLEDMTEGEFLCKPGAMTNEDKGVYNIYQTNTTLGYLCENAVGILQPLNQRHKDQFILFMLEDGNDTVYLSHEDLTPAVFQIGDSGNKQFRGSGGRNEFHFSGYCDNSLAGNLMGGQADQDSIMVKQTCGEGLQLLIDFRSGEMKFLNPGTSLYQDLLSQYAQHHTRKQFNWTFSKIEEIYGRKVESDFAIVSCETKRVALQGGTKLNPDLVMIEDIMGCKHNITLLVENYTTVLSNATHGDITFLIDKQAEGISLTSLIINSTVITNTVFVSLASKDFSSFELRYDESQFYAEINLTISSTSNLTVDPVSFRLLNATKPYVPSIFFTEEPQGSPKSILYVSSDNALFVYHKLSGMFKDARRAGSPIARNIFEIINDFWEVVGGKLDDYIYLQTSVSKNISIDGCGGINTLVLFDNDENDHFVMKTVIVNLNKGIFGLLHVPDSEQSSITNVQNLIGRPDRPEIFFSNCSTNFIDGQGGVSLKIVDTIYISRNDCNIQKLSVNVPHFTTVINSAPKGKFTYFVQSFSTSKFIINVSHLIHHHFHYLFHPWQFIEKITFDLNSETVAFKLLDSKKLFFNMTRSSLKEEYRNPAFQFHGSAPDSVITTVGVNQYGAVTTTYSISGRGPSLQNDVIGVSVDINRFLININETNTENPGCILGSNYSDANQFWIFNLKQPLQALDGGRGKTLSNYLQLDKDFEAGNSVIVELGENGYLTSSREKLIQSLKNIHVFHGRTSKDKDKVTLTCETKIVAEVEEVLIRQTDSCNYNLAIEVGMYTTVWYLGEKRNLYYSSYDVFNYRFQSPRSFDPQGDTENISWLTESNHNYIFPFTLNDLISIEFDREEEKLCYLVKNYTSSGPLCHSMLKSLSISDQFYTQPSMITEDGFRIQINRIADILLSSGAASSFPSLEVIQADVIPTLEEISKRLDVTLILQNDKEYFHVGHDNPKLSRNVLQAVGIVTSHLVGAGKDNTIYEITSLENDVYIYSGLDEVKEGEDNNAGIQQILMLTEVVMNIRMRTRTKYIPIVYAAGNNLVISMKPHEKIHPGRIIIVNGISVFGKIQILVQNTMMSLHLNHERNEWKMKPEPVQVFSGALYYIAPEDLEDNQEILYDLRSNKDIKTNFTAFRNNTDLIITDMLGRSKTENDNGPVQFGLDYTTLVISSFFEEITDPNASEKVRSRRSPVDSVAIFPRKISGVRINFPGLNLILEGTKVFIYANESENLPLTQAKLENWKIELREAEKDLLQDVPSTLAQPIFQYDENYTDPVQSSILGVVMLGLLAVVVIVIVLAIVLVLRNRNIFPFNNQLYRPPTTVARINCQSDSNNDNGMELVEYHMEGTPRHQDQDAETCYELSVQKVTLTTYQISQNKTLPFSASSLEK